MNQDTHLYIEANQKHGRGYQVHIVIDGIVDSTMADEPFSLYDALGGAQFTLEAVNKERGTNYLLPDVLLVSREAAMAERQTDFLSAKLLRENSSKTGPWLTIREKQRRRAASRPARRSVLRMPPHGRITNRRETMSAWPSAGTLRPSATATVC